MIGPAAFVSGVTRLAFVTAGVVGLTPQATGQSLVYNLSARNVTQGTARGTAVAANLGDVIRVWVDANHSGLSVGRASFSIRMKGLEPLAVLETSTEGFDLTDDLVGRHPHLRNGLSDHPLGAVGRESIVSTQVGIRRWTLTDATFGPIDLESHAPPMNPLVGLFPIASGEQFFAFDARYVGGRVVVIPELGVEHRIYRSSTDETGVPVVGVVGTIITVTPTPSSMALLSVGGLLAARRRRA